MTRGHIISKERWKKLIWDKAWSIEDKTWCDVTIVHNKMDLIKMVTVKPVYSVWWMLADRRQEYMRRCELMIKLLCHASRLKDDDNRLLKSSLSNRSCTLCDHTSLENVLHMVMQCPHHYNTRVDMYAAISEIGSKLDNACNFKVLMGGVIEGWNMEGMLPIWQISCTYIAKMYYSRIKTRVG